jgi:Sigma-70, region 4/Putative zinc-finger
VAERAQTRDDLREALTHLPSIYSTAVVLHDAEGLTVAEVAQITGTGIPAARQRLRRGRMMLVSALADARTPPQRGVPMRCWEARSQVSDYLDGALDPGPAHALEAHLAGCVTCRRCSPPWSPPATPSPATLHRRTPLPSSPRSSPTGSPHSPEIADPSRTTAAGRHRTPPTTT